MAKKEIKFNKSMNIDKRNEDFAYLRKNLGSVDTAGLYPAVDFVDMDVSGLEPGDDILGIAGSEYGGNANRGPFIYVDRSNTLYIFNKYGQLAGYTPRASTDVSAIANGSDGVYFVNDDDEKVYSNLYQNNNIVERGTFPENPQVEIGVFDGLYYWWVGRKIWRQLPDEDPEITMTNTGFSNNVQFIANYQDYLVIAARDEFSSGTDAHKENSTIYFYDKKNSAVFYKRVNLKHRTILGLANLNETLTLIYSESNVGSTYEQAGKIVVSQWSGERFVEINSIKTARFNAEVRSSSLSGFTCDYNSDHLIFSVGYNTKSTGATDLYKNFVYKVDYKGNIEVLSDNPVESPDYISGVFIGNEFTNFWVGSSGGNKPKVYQKKLSYSASWENLSNFTTTEYTSNFYCNPYNRHKLNAVNISAEKLFKAGTEETLDVYYRTSEREDWTLLGNITTTKVLDNVNLRKDSNSEIPISQQRYQFTKMPDLTSLPEFNEIQFKFNSKNGFSVIGAWFEYENLTRDTVK